MPRNLISVEDASIAYGDRVILDAVSLGVSAGDRIGVVGRNGGGKSTLLRVLSGATAPDSGRVTRAGTARLGVVAQVPAPTSATTVRERVLGDRPEHAWAADARIRSILTGLLGGHGDALLDRGLEGLSGGERQRVELAAVLIEAPEVLLLDEPTNHLDVRGIGWLAEHLGALREVACVIVTHDRWFLDAVTERTWEVVAGSVEEYEGGYSAYVLAKAERTRQTAAAEARRANLLRKELAWLRRGAPARTTKPKFRVDAANELISREPPPRDDVELMRFAAQRLGRTVYDLDGVTLAVGDRNLIAHATRSIGPGDRIGILGPNGAGKSTLLAALLGARAVDGGRIKVGTTVRPRILSQRLEDLDGDLRVLEAVREVAQHVDLGRGREISAVQLCERLGFDSGSQWTPVRDLSGGERRRLQLTRILMSGPNVLMLDEPTNDLDVETLTSLEDLLDGFAGTLIVVSHDRYLLERVCDSFWAITPDGRLRDLPGGIDEYLARGMQSPAAPAERSRPAPGGRGGERRALEKQAASIERRIATQQQRAAELHAALAEHATDHERLLAETAALREVEATMTALEAEWFEVLERIEDLD